MKGHRSFRLAIALLMSMALMLSSVSTAATKTLTFQSPPPQPPPNDNFANATVVSSLPFNNTVSINMAGTEPYEPQFCDYSPQTVWYSFTPSIDIAVRVSLADSSISNNILHIYQAYGSGIYYLDHLNCVLASGSTTLIARAGTTYYFQAGSTGEYTSSGNVRINVEQFPPPPNDNWANAQSIGTLPFDGNIDASGATRETGEPTPSCAIGYYPGGTIWYAFTPQETRSISANAFTSNPLVLAIYTGSSLTSLTEIRCGIFASTLTFRAIAGTTYYFQVANPNAYAAVMGLHVEFTPLPQASFYFYPNDPSVFDTVQFYDSSYDPAGMGIQSEAWNLGDGTTATGCCPNHRYAAEADYTVELTVTTTDERTASTSQVVHVKTHDVAITRFTAPQSASVGQTRSFAVDVNSKRYVENVQVQLFKSVPGGYQLVGTLTQQVPVRPSNRTTSFKFSYTFTKDDATIGKVTFRAVATLIDARDALPADNEAIASPTKVSR